MRLSDTDNLPVGRMQCCVITLTLSHNLNVHLHDACEHWLCQVLRVPGQVSLGQTIQHLHGDVAVVHQAVHLHCRLPALSVDQIKHGSVTTIEGRVTDVMVWLLS